MINYNNVIFGPAFNFKDEYEKKVNDEKINTILSDSNWRRNSMLTKYTLLGLLQQPETLRIIREVSLLPDHKSWKSDYKIYFTNGNVSIVEVNGNQHFYHSDLCKSNEEFLNTSYRSFTKDLSAEISKFSRLNVNMLIPYYKPTNYKSANEKSTQELAMKEAINSEEFRKAYLEAMNTSNQINFNIREKNRVILSPRKVIKSQLELSEVRSYVCEFFDFDSSIDLINDYLANCVFDHKNDFLYEK